MSLFSIIKTLIVERWNETKLYCFRYKRRIRRSNIKIVEAPVRALIPASLPPGSVMGPAPSLLGQANNPSIHGSQGRIYEWQETAMPIDTASYRSLPR